VKLGTLCISSPPSLSLRMIKKGRGKASKIVEPPVSWAQSRGSRRLVQRLKVSSRIWKEIRRGKEIKIDE
jgi:hypothetical protein